MAPIHESSRRERQIMDVLYRRGAASVADVVSEMVDPPSYSAVRATLRVLEEKGRVTHTHDGPRYVYQPALDLEHARHAALMHVVQTFFDGSIEETVRALLRVEGGAAGGAADGRVREWMRHARGREQ